MQSTVDPARLHDGGNSSYTKTFKSSHVECATGASNKCTRYLPRVPVSHMGLEQRPCGPLHFYILN
jgi:hypothetical protein